MRRRLLPSLLTATCAVWLTLAGAWAEAEVEPALGKAVLLYASFDESVKADVAGGRSSLSTRYDHATEKGKFVIEKGYPEKAFRIAAGKGIQGGALECIDALPRNGRMFFPARGNIGYREGGWGGAVSTWVKTDPDRLLKTKFCDPVQITQKGANNGGIWFDFNDARPRDLRMGIFPAIKPGEKGMAESDPKAPMVWQRKIGFKADDWHHVVLTWANLDTGKDDARAVLWIDGKRIGQVEKRPLAMAWDLDRAGIYVAVNYIGLLDEFAVFSRELTEKEVLRLFRTPGVLAGLKKAK